MRSEAEQDRFLLDIYAIARRIAGQRLRKDQADEVAQAVVAACLESVRTNPWPIEPENLEAFVYAMVKNQKTDWHRSRRASARRDANDLRTRTDAQPTWISPSTAVEEELLSDFKQRVLDSLPIDCVAAFYLVRELKLTHQDTAVSLGVPTSTIRVYLTQVYERFRSELRSIDIEPGALHSAVGAKPTRRTGHEMRLTARFPRPASLSATLATDASDVATHAAVISSAGAAA
jgi:RNA polymerase sigma factor (sigma-70 family)